MAFAEVSRPASGLEHYFSHLWEMMALDRDAPCELHGVQVGVGTLLALQIYDEIKALKPDRERADVSCGISVRTGGRIIRGAYLGKGRGNAVIEQARREGRNDRARQQERLERILLHWDEILGIIGQELPPAAEIASLMKIAGMPLSPADLGIGKQGCSRRAGRFARHPGQIPDEQHALGHGSFV